MDKKISPLLKKIGDKEYVTVWEEDNLFIGIGNDVYLSDFTMGDWGEDFMTTTLGRNIETGRKWKRVSFYIGEKKDE